MNTQNKVIMCAFNSNGDSVSFAQVWGDTKATKTLTHTE